MQILRKAFALVLILSFLVPITNNLINLQAADFDVQHLHLTWQHDPKTTMTMSWMTDVSTSSIVQYGLDSSYGSQEEGVAGKWHHVEITGLTPETFYHYRVGDGTTWSPDYLFRTGRTGNYTKFLDFGDSQSSTPARYEIINAIDPITVDFSLYTGDFVEISSEVTEWYDWFHSFRRITVDTPFMTTMGNHEKNHSYYYEFFALPGGEEFYSFDYGPIHFPVLHTYYEGYEDLGGDYDNQAAWLEADLAANDDALWTVVMMHRPPFSSFPRHYELSEWYKLINETFVPIFEAYQVDVVVMGHEHGYERMFLNNVTYIISGGAGSRLYNPLPQQQLPFSVYMEADYNFVIFEVDENKLQTITYRKDYSVMDQYVKNKVDKVDLSFESLPIKYTKYWNETFEVPIMVRNTGEQNITVETRLKYEGAEGTQYAIIPPLDINEGYEVIISYTPEQPETVNAVLTLDIDSELDEVSEENNEMVLIFEAQELPKKSSFALTISILMALISILAVPVINRRRKNQ